MSDEKNNQENATPERRKPRRPSQMAQEETKTSPAAETPAENNGEKRKPRRPSREGQSSEPNGEGEERKPRRPSRAASSTDAPAEGGERKPRRSSTSSRAGSRKKKKDQMPIGMAVFAGIIAFALYLNFAKSGELAMYWVVGICFGFILRRASFCFTASMRDPYLTGSTSVTRAVLIAFAITSIGFTAIKYGYFRMGLPIPGMSYVVPISVATGVGAFIFGIGMVIAGGCASGTLMRVGEGFHMQVLSLLFFVIGSLWGAHDFGFWKRTFMISGKKVFLPDYFGWFGGIAVNLLIIVVLYIAAEKWENRKNAA
jgi:uncharacterized membrane protein YedE/YeeE